jgi:hypothetical protein
MKRQYRRQKNYYSALDRTKVNWLIEVKRLNRWHPFRPSGSRPLMFDTKEEADRWLMAVNKPVDNLREAIKPLK